MKAIALYIIRNIIFRPALALMLVAALAVSSGVFCLAADFERQIMDEAVAKRRVTLGDSTINMTFDESSNVRFFRFSQLTTNAGYSRDDFEYIIGGYNFTTVISGKETDLPVMACAYRDIFDTKLGGEKVLQKFNPFELLEFRPTPLWFEDDVIISKSMAESLNAKLGDKITLLLGDKKMQMTVTGIASNDGLFSENNILLDYEGVLSIASRYLPTNLPLNTFNTALLRLNDPDKADHYINLLKSISSYKDKAIELSVDYNQLRLDNKLSISTYQAIAFLIISLMFVVVFFMSLYRLRGHDYAIKLMREQGADRHLLAFALLLEIILFGAVSSLIGAAVITIMMPATSVLPAFLCIPLCAASYALPLLSKLIGSLNSRKPPKQKISHNDLDNSFSLQASNSFCTQKADTQNSVIEQQSLGSAANNVNQANRQTTNGVTAEQQPLDSAANNENQTNRQTVNVVTAEQQPLGSAANNANQANGQTVKNTLSLILKKYLLRLCILFFAIAATIFLAVYADKIFMFAALLLTIAGVVLFTDVLTRDLLKRLSSKLSKKERRNEQSGGSLGNERKSQRSGGSLGIAAAFAARTKDRSSSIFLVANAIILVLMILILSYTPIVNGLFDTSNFQYIVTNIASSSGDLASELRSMEGVNKAVAVYWKENEQLNSNQATDVYARIIMTKQSDYVYAKDMLSINGTTNSLKEGMAVVSSIISNLLGLSVGDTISVPIGDRSFDVPIGAIEDSDLLGKFLIVESSQIEKECIENGLRLPVNNIFLDLDEQSRSQTLSAIRAKYGLWNIVIVEQSTIVDKVNSFVSDFISYLMLCLTIICLGSAATLFLQLLIKKKGDTAKYKILSESGASNHQIYKISLLSLLLSTLLSIPFGLLLAAGLGLILQAYIHLIHATLAFNFLKNLPLLLLAETAILFAYTLIHLATTLIKPRS